MSIKTNAISVEEAVEIFCDPVVEYQEELSWYEELRYQLKQAEDAEDYKLAYNLSLEVEQQGYVLDALEAQMNKEY